VENLHFYVDAVPVDLNLKSLERIRHLEADDGFHLSALLNVRIRYDPGGSVGRELERLRERQREASPKALSEHDVAFTRHGHKHILDKVRGRFDTMPLLCLFLLGTDIYWLVQIYFRVRELPFEGEKRAIEYLQGHELEIYHDLAVFYATDQPAFR
jgi:hypothetical protein